jgi:hypothetical protein
MTGRAAVLGVALGLLLQPAAGSAPTIDAIDRDIRGGVYGNVDRLLVISKDARIADFRYSRDYRAISRGRIGPIGCGDGCTDPSCMHEFN